MEKVELVETLRKKFGDSVSVTEDTTGMPVIEIEPSELRDLLARLKDDGDLLLDYLVSLSGMDYREKRGVVYHLRSMKHLYDVVVKCSAPADNPVIPSVTSFWPSADWFEREAFDMFGINFEGHPDLTRLFLPDDWEGYPLLKDYVFPESYHGIPHKEIDTDVE